MIKISLLVPDMPQHGELLPFLREIDESRWYTNFGPLSRRLEAGLQQALGAPAPEVAMVANCTLGLELSLVALGLQPGAKVLVPALTFVATAAAVQRAGFEPLLADVDADSWLLTPRIARAAVSRHGVACVMPVSTFGCPQPVAEWDRFAGETGIPVIIDAAGAFGNQAVGEKSTVVFSFHATKSLGMGEGGMVVSRQAHFVQAIRRLSNFGIDTSSGLSGRSGSNAKLSEYHAAVGLAALARWPERMKQRRKLAVDYADLLRRHCPSVSLQRRPVDGVYAIMQVSFPDGVDSVGVARQLARQGIETRRWYLPLLPEHPAFSSLEIDGDIAVSRKLASRLLGLPFHLDLAEANVLAIVSALQLALDESS